MYRTVVGVFVFVAFVVLGVGSYVYAQEAPLLPTCPDFGSGSYTFYQQRIRLCTEYGTDPFRESSSGTVVFTQIANPPQPALGIEGSPYGCLFTVVKTKRWSNGVQLSTPEVSEYTGVFRGATVTMQAVPRPLADGYLTPPVVLSGDVVKSERRTKIPTEIRYTFNTNEGEIYNEVYNPEGGAPEQPYPRHCAYSGSGIIYRNTPQ